MTSAGFPRPDRVVLRSPEGPRELGITEFLKLPIEKQVELLFQGNVSFFAGATPLRTLDALKVLREERAKQGSSPVQ